MIHWSVLHILYLANMAVFCNFGQPNFVRWLMSDGFVRQSKRALSRRNLRYSSDYFSSNLFLYCWLHFSLILASVSKSCIVKVFLLKYKWGFLWLTCHSCGRTVSWGDWPNIVHTCDTHVLYYAMLSTSYLQFMLRTATHIKNVTFHKFYSLHT